MSRYDVHVLPQGDRWVVLREGDGRPVSVHRDLTRAEVAGRQLAEDGGVGFVLHLTEAFDDRSGEDPRHDG